MIDTPAELERLHQAAQGDSDLLGAMLSRCQDRLLRMVRLRLDRRLQGRIDPADVVQEAFLEASARLDEYLRNPAVPFFVWVRFLALQRLALAHRQHLGVHARNAGREVSLYRGALPQASSTALAAQLVGKLTSPSQAAVKAELKIRLQEALNSMEEIDREVLALRHFEQLSNSEVSQVLEITPSAACNRYVRALERLKSILASVPGGLEP